MTVLFQKHQDSNLTETSQALQLQMKQIFNALTEAYRCVFEQTSSHGDSYSPKQ